MKNYNDIADRVFRRRDEYLEKKKRKKAIFIRRASIALSCCLMILVGIGIWKADVLLSFMPPKDSNQYTTSEAETATSATTAAAITATTADITTTKNAAATTVAVTETTRPTVHTTAALSTAEKTSATTTRGAPSGNKDTVRTTASGMEVTSPSRTTVTSDKTSSHVTSTSTRITSYIITSTSRTTSITRTTRTATSTSVTTRITTTSVRTTTQSAAVATTSAGTMLPPATSMVYTTITETAHITEHYATFPVGTTTTGAAVHTTTTTQAAPTTAETTAVTYNNFYYNYVRYTITEWQYEAADINGEELSQGRMYVDSVSRYVRYTVYSYADFDPKFLCMVKFEDSDDVYIGVNEKFTAKTVADFINSTKISKYAKHFDMYLYDTDEVYSELPKDKVMEQFTDLRQELRQQDETIEMSRVSIYFILYDPSTYERMIRLGEIRIDHSNNVTIFMLEQPLTFDMEPDAVDKLIDDLK